MATSDPANETEAVVEVEFEVCDPAYPLVSIPEQLGCRARVEQIVPRPNHAYAIFYSVVGVNPADVLPFLEGSEGIEAHAVTRGADGGVVEVRVENPEEHFVVALTEAGAIPTDLRSEAGVARIVAEVPAVHSVQRVIETFTTAHPSVEVVAQRQKQHAVPLFTRREFQRALDDLLTPRQREVMLAAYVGGYYDWPRGKSGEEVAAELDISLPTFSQHLREAERKLMSLVFGECDTRRYA